MSSFRKIVLSALVIGGISITAEHVSAAIVTLDFVGKLDLNEVNSGYALGALLPISVSFDNSVAGTAITPGVMQYYNAITSFTIGTFSITPASATSFYVLNDYFDGTFYRDGFQIRADRYGGGDNQNESLGFEFLSYASVPSTIVQSLVLPTSIDVTAFSQSNTSFTYSFLDTTDLSLGKELYGHMLTVAPSPNLPLGP